MSTKDELLIFNCLKEFCDRDTEKFCLMFKKGVYSYEHMDSWKKSDETSFPEKEDFCGNLNMEGITEADYKHVWKDFEIKNLGDYRDS